jgi:hypothetical protein
MEKTEFGARHAPPVKPVKAVRPQILGSHNVSNETYGSISMSSRGSQEMIYQSKFKSLHGVKKSGKMKI